MTIFVSNAATELWVISLAAVLCFHALLWMLSFFAKKSNIYLRVFYFICSAVYIGIFKINFYNTQEDIKSLAVTLAMIYMLSYLLLSSKKNFKV